ncbi:hypothetical protein BZZ08_01854 [Streptomyces sp. MH60]|nr:hypothetical protein BZZ08_01854 [Streptomyces sp. MH60]
MSDGFEELWRVQSQELIFEVFGLFDQKPVGNVQVEPCLL